MKSGAELVKRNRPKLTFALFGVEPVGEAVMFLLPLQPVKASKRQKINDNVKSFFMLTVSLIYKYISPRC